MMSEGTEERKGEKRRRHRKKYRRQKRTSLNEDHLKLLFTLNTDDKFWDVKKVTEIINRPKGPMLYGEGGSQWLSSRNDTHLLLEELFSPQCIHVLGQVNPRVLDDVRVKLRFLMPKIGRIRFRRVLNDHIPAHKGHKCAYLISNPLERRQLHAFVTKLFVLLFNAELLDHSNVKMFCENIATTFTDLRNRGFLMSRTQILKGIRFDQILWLKGLHFQLKRSIALNILKSFLNLFTRIFTDVWRRICSQSFDLLRAERKLRFLLTTDALPDLDDQIHKLIFLPKKCSVRPIVILRNARLKNKLNAIHAVLRFLISQCSLLSEWGISNLRLFAFAFRRLSLQYTRGPQKGQRMHFCTADLNNCYTSFEHNVLDEILRKITPSESKFVVVSVQVTSKIYKYRKTKTEAGLSYDDAFSRIICKGSEEFNSPFKSEISSVEFLKMITQFAMRTVIREPFCALTSSAQNRPLRQRLFVSGRGIGQGSSLSVALCNLYLGWVERQICLRSPEIGLTNSVITPFCCRYMDDYLIISDKRERIEKLIDNLMCEMPKFGLYFGKVNTSFQLQCQSDRIKPMKSKDKLQWCGLAINRRTLSLTVDYCRYRQRRPSISFPSSALRSSDHFRFICNTIKRALNGRMNLLRNCARVWSAKRRTSLRRDFCRFAYSHYIRQILQRFSLNPKDVFVRDFLSQLSRYIWNGFRKQSLPSQLASSLICNGPVVIFQV
ncbi:hypothetical protein niasHT_000191 [Heterodera trifolii]|uniref:Telomerase reverse transcriptase n=1 Tax=Heterodera trifolii TaxID=157864 RepID=A0ABD2LWN0_9BILA